MGKHYEFLSNADEVRIEVFRRDLSKRQKAIVWMIHMFSMSMGKTKAIIPQLKDFENCGVAKTKIRSELEKLVELHVIDWKEETNTFIIHHPDTWNAPVNPMWNQVRFSEIYDVNTRDKKFG